MAELPQAEIGIFGGSGFYSLFEGDYEEVSLDTRWGQPSDVYTVGTIGGRKVAFLPATATSTHLRPRRSQLPCQPLGHARAGREAGHWAVLGGVPLA